jgi:hypothetical protein
MEEKKRLYNLNCRKTLCLLLLSCMNRILPKEINANRFFSDSHWLEIWKNHFCPSMGPNGGSVAMGSVSGASCALEQFFHAIVEWRESNHTEDNVLTTMCSMYRFNSLNSALINIIRTLFFLQ